MIRFVALLNVVVILSLLTTGCTPPRDIDKLIRQLDSDNFSERQKAVKDLIEIGEPALPKVISAYKESDSAEQVLRAEKVIEGVCACEVSGQRKKVMDLIRAVESARTLSSRDIQALSECVKGIGDPLLRSEFGEKVRDVLRELVWSALDEGLGWHVVADEFTDVTIMMVEDEYAKERAFNALNKKGQKTKKKEIEKLIEELGSDDSGQRDRASRQLREIGRPALGQLREAMKNHPDIEIRLRSEQLVHRIDFLPSEIEEFIALAHAKDWTAWAGSPRQKAMDKLVDLWKVADAKAREKIEAALEEISFDGADHWGPRVHAMDNLFDLWKDADAKTREKIEAALEKISSDPKEREDIRERASGVLHKISTELLRDWVDRQVKRFLDFFTHHLQTAPTGVYFTDEVRDRALAELEALYDREDVSEEDIPYTLAALDALEADSQLEPPTTTLGIADDPIIMSLVPSGETQEIISNGEQLAEMLLNKTGLVIEVSIADDYTALRDAMDAGRAHIGWLNAFNYVLAHEQYGVDVALVTVHFDSTFYRSQINVRADSGINSLEDLRGKRMCWVDPGSTSGYIIPRIMLQANGIDPDNDFAEAYQAGSHNNVIMHVYHGECDAGATYEDARNSVEKDITDEVIVLATTPMIPNDCVSFVGDFPADLREQVVDVLVEIADTEEGEEVLGGLYAISGLERTDDSLYDGFRTVLIKSRVDIEELTE